MTNEEKNVALTRTWIDDETDEYTRCVLASMIAASRNPNNSSHTGPLSPEVCRHWARGEHRAANEGCDRCAYTAEVLDQLADKLHDLEQE